MEFSVTAKGPTLDQVTRDLARDLTRANRTVSRDLARVGARAMGKGAPHMMGEALTVRGKPTGSGAHAGVEFLPGKGQAGAWAIAEAGRRGGYLVRPRKAKALRLPGGFAETARPGKVAARRAWTKAVARLVKAADDTIKDVYGDALGAD